MQDAHVLQVLVLVGLSVLGLTLLARSGTATLRSDRESYRQLKSALLADKRAALVGLRDARLIDDIVLRRVQARLDAEEVRLSASLEPDSD